MELKPTFGIADLIFGMRQEDVLSIYGKPDKEFRDEDSNIIYVYHKHKLRLTFYEDEDLRLGYIICSSQLLTIDGKKIIGQSVGEVKQQFPVANFKSWEEEDFDITINHFNEDNWVILQSEFGDVIKVEAGAIIKDDQFVWKYKKKA